MNKNLLSFVILIVLLICTLLISQTNVFAESIINDRYSEKCFEDVLPGKWYSRAVLYCKENGYMSGTSETTFSPDAAVTRAMAVTILWRISGSETVNVENPFIDVPTNKWYTKAVLWAKDKGVASGVSFKYFAPDDEVSREQLALMFMMCADKISGYDVSGAADLSLFNDEKEISSWAKDAVAWAVDEGLLSGKGNGILDPSGPATRAELAQIIYKYVTTRINYTYTSGLLEKYHVRPYPDATVELDGNKDPQIYTFSIGLEKTIPGDAYPFPTVNAYARIRGGNKTVYVRLTQDIPFYLVYRDNKLIGNDDMHYKLEDVFTIGDKVRADVTFVIGDEMETITFVTTVESALIWPI